MIKQSALAIAVVIVSVASVAFAQQFIITPVESNRDVDRRIWQLERAVQELQSKVYNLQTAQATNNNASMFKRYFCHVSAFGKSYKAYGPTETEARDSVASQCTKDYPEMHCSDVVCEPNK